MVDALADMKHVLGRDSNSLQRHFENIERGFVGARLLSSNHLVERDFEARRRVGKQVIIYV